MTKQEFYGELEKHDWYYYFSDDFGVVKRGEEERNRLKNIAKADPELKKLYDSYYNHMFSGESWGTEKLPKPTI